MARKILEKATVALFAFALFIGHGIASSDTPQGKMMARRAAIVDIYRQAGGSAGMQIVSESFSDGVYEVQAEF